MHTDDRAYDKNIDVSHKHVASAAAAAAAAVSTIAYYNFIKM